MGDSIQLSLEALFRHQVVSLVGCRVRSGMPVTGAIAEVLALDHQDLAGKPRRLSERTVYRWMNAFAHGGVAALEPSRRQRITTSRALDKPLLKYVEEKKLLDGKTSIPEILRLARATGIPGADEVSRTSVWRACKRMGLPLSRPSRQHTKDMRRFAYAHRMMMVLADGKHFRAGSQRRRRVALTLLDDATRFGLTVVVGTSENTELFLQACHQAVGRAGLMTTLFVDNGPGFVSQDSRTVLARLGVQLVYGTPAYPQGHGKIERFHRRLSEQVLRGMDGNPAVDPDPAALTLRLQHWLFEIYNQDPHQGLGGDSPHGRFESDQRPLNYPPEGFERHFIISAERRVSLDNVVSFEGTAFEVPCGYAGTVVTLSRHVLEGNALTMMHQGRAVRLHPVDRIANAHARRGQTGDAGDDSKPSPGDTAAGVRFDHDLGPLVDEYGGWGKGADDE